MNTKVLGQTIVAHLAQTDLSCKTSADCTSLPASNRSCGGPDYFVLLSLRNPSLAALKSSIDLMTKADAEAKAQFGLASICSVEMPPPVDCVADVCQAN